MTQRIDIADVLALFPYPPSYAAHTPADIAAATGCTPTYAKCVLAVLEACGDLIVYRSDRLDAPTLYARNDAAHPATPHTETAQ